MAGDKKPAKKSTKAVKPAEPPKKKVKNPLLPALKKLATHRTTRPLFSKIRKEAKAKKVAINSIYKKPAATREKKIKNKKTGEVKTVQVPAKRARKNYPTAERTKRRTSRNIAPVRRFKAGLEPGRVVIVLAGRHKGKRVVVLKTLPSGFLLITGPHVINGCPVRRMHQQYVIVTSTKLDLSGVKVPENINDAYFKPSAEKAPKGKDGGDVFSPEKEKFKPNEQRKKDQIAVDKLVLDVVRKNPDKKMLMSYLGSFFQLRNRVYPHQLKF